MKILFAADGSRNAEACIQAIQSRLWPEKSSLMIATVYQDLPTLSQKLIKEKAEIALEQAKKNAAEALPKLSIEAKLLKGNVKEQLINFAKQWQPDIMFIGASESKDFTRILTGSIMYALLSELTCPLVVVRRQPTATRRYLLPVDDSQLSHKVVKIVGNRLWPEQAEFIVLHVLEAPLREFSSNAKIDAEMFISYMSELSIRMKNVVDSHVLELQKYLPAQVISGYILDRERGQEKGIADSIVEAARDWEAQAIIMGTRNLQGVDKFLLGSVSEAVSKMANCSVEIIR